MDEECSDESLSPGFLSLILKCAGTIVGTVLVAFSIYAGFSIYGDVQLRQKLAHDGVRVHGTLTDFEGRSSNISDFRFVTADGRTFDASYRGAFSYPELSHLKAGAKVDVVYVPDDPTQAIPEPFAQVPPCDLPTQMGVVLQIARILAVTGIVAGLLCALKMSAQPSSGPNFRREY